MKYKILVILTLILAACSSTEPDNTPSLESVVVTTDDSYTSIHVDGVARNTDSVSVDWAILQRDPTTDKVSLLKNGGRMIRLYADSFHSEAHVSFPAELKPYVVWLTETCGYADGEKYYCRQDAI